MMNKAFSFSNILVALDLSPMDSKLIAYSRFLIEHSKVRKLRFVHVIPTMVLPDIYGGVSIDYMLQEEEPIEERVYHDLTKEIEPFFQDLDGISIEIDVLSGKPQETLLGEAQKTHPDLLLIGKKTISGISGIIARRIARKTECAVCFVTDNTFANPKKILVPIDFTAPSGRALQTAIALKNTLPEAEVLAVHVIAMPTTAYNINKNFQVSVEVMKASAIASYEKFLEKYLPEQPEVALRLVLNEQLDVAHHICEIAEEENADLLINGAVGHSVFDDIIFGSVTEKLVNYQSKAPILVVR